MLRLALSTDILAIRCLEKHVCIGIGNSIRVYCIATREFVAEICALENDNIHDIVLGPGTKLIVYGGRSLRIYDLKFSGDAVDFQSCSIEQTFTDWIIAVELLQRPRVDDLCILFAHNNLGLYNTTTRQIRSVWCQEKCILYGGSLLPTNNHETIVFAGTVFQEILIWRARNDRDDSEDSPVLHRLIGHKGVIFSVIYEPTLRIISSTSDDRTIRLWRVRNKSVNCSDEVDWSDCEIDLTTTMYGHAARVWRSLIRNNQILSIGEDSLMCTWSLDGKLLNKVEAHNGAEIWSIDVTQDNEFTITGGADGAVNVWHFEPIQAPQITTVLDNDGSSIIPKYVCYMNSKTILLLMDGGVIVGYDTDFKEIQRSSINPRYRTYCVMELSPDRRKIVLGSRDGYATVYEEFTDSNLWRLDVIMENKVVESMILSSHWLTNESILVCGHAGALKLVDVQTNETKRRRSDFVLPPSRERWTTAAIIDEELLICGDRAGTIYVFDLIRDDAGPTQIFPKIHGRLGVQFLYSTGNNVISTGRDGTIRYYENLRKNEKQYLQALHSQKMPMDWVCRILRYDGNIYVLGFKEVEFVVYSMKLKRFVTRFVCGGGHRSWDCKLFDETMKFLYIKDKRVHEIEFHLRNIISKMINGFHTKEIYCCEAVVNSSEHNIVVSAGEDSTIRISCMGREKCKTKRFESTCLCTYDGHISNVKSIAVLNIEDSKKLTRNLVFSGGGRAQLKIWEICVRVDSKILTSQNVTCRQLSSYMLHGSDRDRNKTCSTVNKRFFVDPETRFMDMSARFCNKDSNFIILFVACSDGFLRIFFYDIATNDLRLSLVVGQDYNRCALKVHSFAHDNDIILLSMTTDGTINFWLIDENIESLVRRVRDHTASEITMVKLPLAQMKIHQNGINSYDFRIVDESRYLLLTGGDDNLISLVMFEISTMENIFSVNTVSKWECSTIHSAQITGAKFLGNDRIITAGIDQKVVVHCYAIVDGILSVSRINEINTFVPDVQGLTLSSMAQGNGATLACVYGKGFEVFDLESKKCLIPIQRISTVES